MVKTILGKENLVRKYRPIPATETNATKGQFGVQQMLPVDGRTNDHHVNAVSSLNSRQMLDWRKQLQRLEGAYSDHTLRSYQSAVEAFALWCRRKRVPALPAMATTVAFYLRDEGARLKPATLKHRLAAIRKVHQLCKFEDPTQAPEVDLAMRTIRRSQPSRPKQAWGLTSALCDDLLSACSDDLIGLRDMVLLMVGFDTLCRAGELVALSIQDFTLRPNGRYNVLVRRAKNDPEGAGRLAHLSTRSSELVDRWLAAIDSNTGPLLRPVYQTRALVQYVEPLTVSRVLQKLATRANIKAGKHSKISGHSLRVGAAQQLILNGHDMLKVMRAGGWRSTNVVSRYVENVDVDVWQ